MESDNSSETITRRFFPFAWARTFSMLKESGASGTQSLRPRTPNKLPLLRPVIINKAMLALQPPGNSTVCSLLVIWRLTASVGPHRPRFGVGLPLIGLWMSVYQYVPICCSVWCMGRLISIFHPPMSHRKAWPIVGPIVRS